MRNKYRILSLWANFFGLFILLIPVIVLAPGGSAGFDRAVQPPAQVEIASVPAGTTWYGVANMVPMAPGFASAQPAAPAMGAAAARAPEVVTNALSRPAEIAETTKSVASRVNTRSSITIRSTGMRSMPAPDFNATTLDGKVVSLSSLKGKNVMLNFWASWCGPCENEIPYLQSFYDKISSKDLVILTVNYKESEDIVREYVKDANISMPVALDPSGDISNKYNVFSIPRTYFIDTEGYVQMVKFGGFETRDEIENYLK